MTHKFCVFTGLPHRAWKNLLSGSQLRSWGRWGKGRWRHSQTRADNLPSIFIQKGQDQWESGSELFAGRQEEKEGWADRGDESSTPETPPTAQKLPTEVERSRSKREQSKIIICPGFIMGPSTLWIVKPDHLASDQDTAMYYFWPLASHVSFLIINLFIHKEYKSPPHKAVVRIKWVIALQELKAMLGPEKTFNKPGYIIMNVLVRSKVGVDETDTARLL